MLRIILRSQLSRFLSTSLPKHRILTLPSLSPTMEEGVIQKWNKKIGENLAQGENLVEIATDKTTMPMEVDEEAFLAKILVEPSSQKIKVGTPIAILVENQEFIAAFKDYIHTEQQVQTQKKPAETVQEKQVQKQVETQQPVQSVQQKQEPQIQKAVPKVPTVQKVSKTQQHVKISPRAKALANILELDYQNLSGSGPEGRIIEQDIKKILKSHGSPSFEDKPNSTMRKVIAERLLESKTTIPHYYLSLDIDVDLLIKLRAQLNEKQKQKMSVSDFLIKAAAMSMRHVPEVNSSWQGEYTRFNNQVDVAFACQTPKGLITPIVQQANLKGLQQIAADTKDLANRAREGTLQSHEYQGGTFTISNLGMFGIQNFSAIINPPLSAILAVGKAEERCVPVKGQVKVKNQMSVTLSCDHRSVDGAVGAQWLKIFKDYVENPESLLL